MDIQDIAAILERQGADFAGATKDIRTRLDALELKAARPPLGLLGGGGGDATELKALDRAVRALLAGDSVKAHQHFIEAKAMSAGSAPDGGYVVHPFLSSAMTQVMAAISPVYRLARKVPMTSGDAFEEPVDREAASAQWVSEAAPRGDTNTPNLGLFRAPLHEIFAQPKITQKLIDTASIDVVSWMATKVGEAFANAEGVAFHTGDGVGKPRGFLSYPTASTGDATRAWGTVQHIGTGVSGGFPAATTTVNPVDVLVDCMSAMKAQYRQGAVWLMNRSTAGAVRKLKDADGRHVWVDSVVIGQPAALLGYPVEIDESMPDIGAGTLAIAFANLLAGYTVVEQPGVKFLSDPYTDKPNVRLFNYRRVGGGLNNSEAIKLVKFS